MSDVEEARALLQEIERRKSIQQLIRGDFFDKQLALHDDPNQFRAAHPGRRAGKSDFITKSAILLALAGKFGDTVVIGAETQKKARNLHWGNLQALVVKYNLPLSPNAQDALWVTPWGSKILFWGLSDAGAAELLRGFEVCAAFFDEVATYATLLPRLITVVEPSLGQSNGPLTLCGTPSYTRAGPWFEICSGQEQGWSVHHWTLRENPHFKSRNYPTVDAYLASVRERRGWDLTNAQYRREYMGEFANDETNLVYQFAPERNACSLPKSYDRETWYHTMGVDFGYNPDPCAWSILASHPHENEVYVVHVERHWEKTQEQAAEITARLVDKFKPSTVVGDTTPGYIDTFNLRYGSKVGIGIQTAQKAEKRVGIDLVNTELRTGRLLVVTPDSKELADEMSSLPWKDSYRLKENPAFRNDLCDATLYAFRAHHAYSNKRPAPAVDYRGEVPREERIRRRQEREQQDWWEFQ